jgi:dienelactone hydrolase
MNHINPMEIDTMAPMTRTLEYAHDETRCEGFLALDGSDSSPRPGVLIAPTWAGRDDFAMNKACQLAELGYVALALDMYGEARVGNGPEECSRLMGELMADRRLLLGRIEAGLDALRQQPGVDSNRIAAIGFCFGGLCVLDLARSGADLQGVASFHGLLTPADDQTCHPIRAKVLVLHGFDDPMAPPEQAVALGKELTACKADWQIHLYGNTAHAFTNPKANDRSLGTVYDPAADRRSRQSLQDFLAEVLK